jgi:hypothetical protein
MRELGFAGVVLVLAGCVQTRADPARDAASGCGDAGSPLVPRDLDAGAKDVHVGDAAPSGTSDATPDPNNWSCNVDEHCAVFPALPYCDGHQCSAAEKTVHCTAGAENQQESPEVQHTYIGQNGTFTDRCDGSGNLVDYGCEFKTKCGPGPNPACGNIDTGRVTSTTRDCAGMCVNGRCDGRCPQQGDHITYRDTHPDGSALIRNDSDGRSYDCTLDYDSPADKFDCKAVAVGQTGTVLGRSVRDMQCTGRDFGGFSVVLPGVPTTNSGENCGYDCGIHPEPPCSP